jgi:transcriptional regulator with XRE-family HTH domain
MTIKLFANLQQNSALLRIIDVEKLNTLSERLRYLINFLGISVNEFSKRIGVKQSTMQGYLNDEREPGYSVIAKIKLSYPSISSDWLLTGNGNMAQNDIGKDEKIYQLMIEKLETELNLVKEQAAIYKKLSKFELN